MARRGIRGSIPNVGTNGAARAHRYTIAYDAMKGAMDGFTRAVAVDLGPWGIRVSAIRPSPVLIERSPDSAAPRPYPRRDVPSGHAGCPEGIAWAALFPAPGRGALVTGQALEVDGGLLGRGRSHDAEGQEISTPASIGAFSPPRDDPARARGRRARATRAGEGSGDERYPA
jgi:3-oxoacyl-[acyl-carrier protein] reductase